MFGRATIRLGIGPHSSWLYCRTHHTKILSSHFFAISILNLNYDVINGVIFGFANVVVERCGFHHWIAQTISWGEVVSVFLSLIVPEL